MRIIWKVKVITMTMMKTMAMMKMFLFLSCRKSSQNVLKTYFLDNVNSIRSKFESVQEIIQNTFDIFLASKTKIDSSSLSDIVFTSEISNKLIFYLSTHDNILLMGDFNMTPNNPKLSELIADHELCTLYQNQHVSKVSILLVLITS